MGSCAGLMSPIQVGWETFQQQAIAPNFNPGSRYLPLEVYQKADKTVVECYLKCNDPDITNNSASIAATNLIVRILNDKVRRPFAEFGNTAAICEKVFNEVMSLLPKPGSEVEAASRQELWKRAKNIVSVFFQKEFTFLAQYLMKNGLPKATALDRLITQPKSLADAIGCEAVRDMQRLSLQKREEVRQKFIQGLI